MSSQNIELINETGIEVKVCIYKKGDPGIVPVEGGVLFIEAGGDRSWGPSPNEHSRAFHVKFFKPALLDEFLAGADGVPLGAAVTLYERDGSFYVSVSAGEARKSA